MQKTFTCKKCGKRETIARWLYGVELFGKRLCQDCNYYDVRSYAPGSLIVFENKLFSYYDDRSGPGMLRMGTPRPFDYKIVTVGLEEIPLYCTRFHELSDKCPDWFLEEWKKNFNLVAVSVVQLGEIV